MFAKLSLQFFLAMIFVFLPATTLSENSTFDYIGHNRQYSSVVFPKSFAPDGTPFSELPLVGTSPKMIVTCYDDRVVPEVFFEMTPGNTLVYRNSGGRTATDTGVLKAALVSQFLTHINEIVVVHHTNCGAFHSITDEILIDGIQNQTESADSPWKAGALEEAKSLQPIGFFPPVVPAGHDETAQLDAMLKVDVDFLRNSVVVQNQVVVSGWVYNVSTGVVTKWDY